jgi:hypothetical protein
MARVAGLLALAVCAVAGAEPKVTKTQISSNGAHGVRFEVDGEKCRLVAVKETTEEWSLDRCVGSQDDFFFISNEGDRVWVLHALPKKPAKPARGKKGTPWYSVVVAELIEKDGSFVRAVKLSDVVDARGREKVEQMEKYFKWLEGAMGVKGKGPRINDKDQVEFEVAGPKTQKLGFGAPAP